jgi:hypothetical protein
MWRFLGREKNFLSYKENAANRAGKLLAKVNFAARWSLIFFLCV